MIRPGLIRLIILWALFLLMGLGCQEPSEFKGSFWTESRLKQQGPLSRLELGPNGQGSWSKGEERVLFKWEILDKQIWLHTKSGGVVAGKIVSRDRIEITLPGSGVLIFTKSPK
jgi:hypothetical protein